MNSNSYGVVSSTLVGNMVLSDGYKTKSTKDIGNLGIPSKIAYNNRSSVNIEINRDTTIPIKSKAIYSSEAYNDQVLAQKILSRYLQNPMSDNRRRELILSGLNKLKGNKLSLYDKNGITKNEIQDMYGNKGLKIIRAMKRSAQMKGIEETMDNLSSFSGKVKYELSDIIDEHKKQKCIVNQNATSREFKNAQNANNFQNLIKNATFNS